MHSQDCGAKYKSQNDQPQKLVRIELQENRIDISASGQQTPGLDQETVDALLRLIPDLNGHLDDVACKGGESGLSSSGGQVGPSA